jgi:hypothetical protein
LSAWRIALKFGLIVLMESFVLSEVETKHCI